jgi:hypothetical protein
VVPAQLQRPRYPPRLVLDGKPQCERRGELTSRQDLADKILHFIADYNQTAKPYRWTYTGDILKTA